VYPEGADASILYIFGFGIREERIIVLRFIGYCLWNVGLFEGLVWENEEGLEGLEFRFFKWIEIYWIVSIENCEMIISLKVLHWVSLHKNKIFLSEEN
jgi:hypothetical protein